MNPCKECRFYKDRFCYRSPPQIYQRIYYEHGDSDPSYELESAWPTVGENDTCGEFQERKWSPYPSIPETLGEQRG